MRRTLPSPRHPFAPLALLATLVVLAGCGAKTGLLVPPVDAAADARDAGMDARDAADDSPVVRRPVRCLPLRIHTRVGSVVSLQPDTDVVADTGYTWTLRAQPDGSGARLFSDDGPVANLTPDRAGEYDIAVSIATPAADGGALACSITVLADPPDPRCPGYALAEPRVVDIPQGDMRVAYDVVWGEPRTVAGDGVGAVLSDDADMDARVAAVVIERAASADVSDPMEAVDQEGTAAEQALARAYGATSVFVGRTGTMHEGFPLRRTTLRIGTSTRSNPGALRDQALRVLAGLEPPADPPPPTYSDASAFYVEIGTVLRPDTRRVVTTVALSQVMSFDDPSTQTAIRVNDLVNGTALARADQTVDVRCHQVTATRTLQADFLWLVDTSGSMDDDQERLGDTAEQFFQEMNNAGMDFRVGVMQAGHTTPALRGTPSFHWVAGSDASGARTMAWEVTELAFHGDGADRLQPFRVTGDDEEPIAAAVLAVQEFERLAASGVTTPDFVLRPSAAKVVFFVTDELGSNDVGRYFNATPTNTAQWGRDAATLTQNITRFFTSRSIIPFGLVATNGRGCPNVDNLRECVITAGGGAFIPIETSDDREAQSALAAATSRMVDTIAGQASEFVLPVVPISSSLRVRVNDRIAPRSRSGGFDYQERANTLVFYGSTFRPRVGEEVRAAYFLWSGP